MDAQALRDALWRAILDHLGAVAAERRKQDWNERMKDADRAQRKGQTEQ